MDSMQDQPVDGGTVRYQICSSCQMPNLVGAKRCSRCGQALQTELKKEIEKEVDVVVTETVTETEAETEAEIEIEVEEEPASLADCPSCGEPLPSSGKFCPNCGFNMEVSAPPEEELQPPDSIPIPMFEEGSADETQVLHRVEIPQAQVWLREVKPDGSTGQEFRVELETRIGREDCDLTYPDDGLLSPQHSSLALVEGRVFLRDLDSRNGTFVKQRKDTEIGDGDIFLVGRELFRLVLKESASAPDDLSATQTLAGAPKFGDQGPVFELQHVRLTGETVDRFALDKPEITIGRTGGDILFKMDPYMSGRHARLKRQKGKMLLQDLKSRNGLFRRIRDDVELFDGDEFFSGEQLFRVGFEEP